jgi:hypothetical protein
MTDKQIGDRERLPGLLLPDDLSENHDALLDLGVVIE